MVNVANKIICHKSEISVNVTVLTCFLILHNYVHGDIPCGEFNNNGIKAMLVNISAFHVYTATLLSLIACT